MPEADGDDTEAAADLRFTKHAQDRINIGRDLAADGHIARGDKTRMSRISFTARGRPADPGERDPAFVERETPADVEPDVAAAVVPPAVPSPPSQGIIGRLGRLFGR